MPTISGIVRIWSFISYKEYPALLKWNLDWLLDSIQLREVKAYYTTQLTFCFCWSTACFITNSSFCGNATKWLMIVSAANMGYNKLNIATINVPSYMFQASDPFCCKCLLTICQSVWLIYSDQSVCYVPIIALCHRMLEFSFCNISLGTLIQNISLIL